jgi:hypothetical protein
VTLEVAQYDFVLIMVVVLNNRNNKSSIPDEHDYSELTEDNKSTKRKFSQAIHSVND